jgi:hypothetical protein
MANHDDALLASLRPVDTGTAATADTVAVGGAFDLIADIEIGSQYARHISKVELFGSVLNRTRMKVDNFYQAVPLAAGNTAINHAETVKVSALPTGTQEGDLLEASATLKVTDGVDTDYSTAQTDLVIVVV